MILGGLLAFETISYFDMQAMEHCVGNFRKVNSRLMRARAALLQADVQTALVSIQQVGSEIR